MHDTSSLTRLVFPCSIGYGDIHPVNTREMIFAMVYILFDLIFSAYLVGESYHAMSHRQVREANHYWLVSVMIRMRRNLCSDMHLKGFLMSAVRHRCITPATVCFLNGSCLTAGSAMCVKFTL